MRCCCCCWLIAALYLALNSRAQTIDEAGQLECDFDQMHFCHWRNVRGVDLSDWTLHERLDRATSPLARLHPALTQLDQPDAFALAQGKSGVKHQVPAWLVSDTIPCQAGDAMLDMRLWTSEHALLQICIQDWTIQYVLQSPPTSNALQCGHQVQGVAMQQANWTQLAFTIPASTQPFALVLAAYVAGDRDAVGIDHIVYHADLDCDMNMVDDVMTKNTTTPLPPILPVNHPDHPILPVNKPPTTTISRTETMPPLLGLPSDQTAPAGQPLDHLTDNLPIPSELINSAAPRKRGRVPKSERPYNYATDVKKTNNIIQLPAPAAESTQGYDWDKFINSDSPDEDDATSFVQQQITHSATAGSGASPVAPANQPTDIGSESQCSLAECDFERSLCDMEAYRLDSTYATMRYMCNPLRHNRKFRKAPQGRCLLAMTTMRDIPVIQILASRAFFTTEGTTLSFRYFLPNDGSAMIMVCLNKLRDCIWRAREPRRGLEMWWQRRLKLPAGKLQVYFVLQQRRKGTHVGLDDIRLTAARDPLHRTAATCVLYSDYDYAFEQRHTIQPAPDDTTFNMDYENYEDYVRQQNKHDYEYLAVDGPKQADAFSRS